MGRGTVFHVRSKFKLEKPFLFLGSSVKVNSFLEVVSVLRRWGKKKVGGGKEEPERSGGKKKKKGKKRQRETGRERTKKRGPQSSYHKTHPPTPLHFWVILLTLEKPCGLANRRDERDGKC